MNVGSMIAIQSANNAIRASQIGHGSHFSYEYTFTQPDAQWVLALLCGSLIFWIGAWLRMNPKASFGRKALISANLSGAYFLGFLLGALLYKIITVAMGFSA